MRHWVIVNQCDGCPFFLRDWQQLEPDKCAHPAAQDRELPRTVPPQHDRTPPPWCPLRTGATVVRIGPLPELDDLELESGPGTGPGRRGRAS